MQLPMTEQDAPVKSQYIFIGTWRNQMGLVVLGPQSLFNAKLILFPFYQSFCIN